MVLSGGEVDIEPLQMGAGPFLGVTEVDYTEVSTTDTLRRKMKRKMEWGMRWECNANQNRIYDRYGAREPGTRKRIERVGTMSSRRDKLGLLFLAKTGKTGGC